MLKLIAVVCLFLLSWNICKAQDPSIINIDSKILGEQRKSFVYLPPDYNSTDEKYPVMYVFDGEYNSGFTAEAVNVLCQSERIPPCIVIGITSADRGRDFTPAEEKEFKKPDVMKDAGGADKFLNYIQNELLTYVDKNYRTQPYRIIIGHSLGGLLAMYSFSSRPDLFQAYIALESSLWWNDGAVGKSTMDFLNSHPQYKGKLFMARIKMPREVWFPINITLVDYFEKNTFPGLEYKYMELEDEIHPTMVFPATYLGIKNIFSDYILDLNENSNEKTILSYYSGLSEKYGYPVPIPQEKYNYLWDISMRAKKYDDAIKFGELRIKHYPNSVRAYNDLAKTYSDMGKKDKADELLNKAKSLNPGG